ncbi:hypothetical protein Vi05172_g11698 [Venturia inaequalis]|nr:hypothetical protein Vi05172_g11698 [Venturia inaequalis]
MASYTVRGWANKAACGQARAGTGAEGQERNVEEREY